MSPFISPAESLIIGLCAGEYLDHDLVGMACGMSFIGFLDRRLGSFFPALRRHRVQAAERPDTIVWASGPIGNVGVSPDRPRCMFSGSERGACEFVFNFSRRSLLDLLILQLGDAMRLFGEDRFLYALESDPRAYGNWSTVVRVFERQSAELARFIEEGEDDPPTIEKRLVEIMKFNECRHLYDIGRRFGEILSTLDRIARWVYLTDGDQQPNVTESAIGPILDSLLATPLVQNTDTARALLTEIRQTIPGHDLHDYDAYREHADTYRALWLAFGELVSVLRDADLAVRAADSSSPVPRAFCVLATDTPDRVLEVLHRVERELSESPVDELRPYDLVNRLSAAIEALARRLWPDHFGDKQGRESLGAVLHNHLQSEIAAESRFASIALTLHRNYRNSAQHNLDDFTCTLNEARLFVQGVWVLVELTDSVRG